MTGKYEAVFCVTSGGKQLRKETAEAIGEFNRSDRVRFLDLETTGASARIPLLSEQTVFVSIGERALSASIREQEVIRLEAPLVGELVTSCGRIYMRAIRLQTGKGAIVLTELRGTQL